MKMIGWKEIVDLPDLGLYNIPAKVDTGARTSVLHCSHIELIEKEKKQYVRFSALDERFGLSADVHVLPFHSERIIKNSFGIEENRYVIHTRITLFNQLHEIELSLRDRSDMEFPMLLGRSFIRKKYLVDVSRANLSIKKAKQASPKT